MKAFVPATGLHCATHRDALLFAIEHVSIVASFCGDFMRAMRSIRSLLLATFLLLAACAPLLAQTPKTSRPLVIDTTRHARVANQEIAAGIERSTGHFWVETASGTPLLYRRDAITSATTIRAGGRTYTNATAGSGQTPPGTRALPTGVTDVLADRLRWTTRIADNGILLDVEQEFLPSLDSTYAHVRITTTLINRGAAAVEAGALLMLDLVIDDVDRIDLSVDGVAVTHERGWFGSAVPGGYLGRTPRHPWEVVGRLDGRGATRPDRFVAGRWQWNSFLGAALWDYVPSPQEIWDAAVLMQWNARSIAPGARVSFTTDYGVLTRYAVTLACPDTLRVSLAPDGAGYQPDPLPIPVSVRNTATGMLRDVQAVIALPGGIVNTGSDTAVVVPSPLPPGGTGLAEFRVHVPARDRDTILTCRITVTTSEGIHLVCTVPVVIPAVPPPPPPPRCVMNGLGTRGTEFWTGFPENNSSTNIKRNLVYVTAFEDAQVRVERPGSGQRTDVTVLAGTTARIDVEDALDDHVPEQVAKKGVRITSDRPVTVVAGTLNALHSDATLVLPMHALGSHHVTAGYNFFNPDEQVLVVGAHDGTTVTIAPGGVTSENRPARRPYQITLDAGDTYLLRAGLTGAGGGLTGTVVSADRPVAVLSGARSGWVPTNNLPWYAYLNPHYHQMIPTSLCGVEYVAAPFATRRGGSTFKVVATEDATDVTVRGGPNATLALAGDAMEFTIDAPVAITASRAVQVVQFAHSAAWDADTNEYGDAMMIAHTPVSRFVTCLEIAAGLDDRFDSSFVTVFAHAGSGVLLDDSLIDAGAFAPIAGTSLGYAHVMLSRGMHRLESLDRRGMGAVVYGFEHHDAFGYNAGFLVVDSTVMRVPDAPLPDGIVLQAVRPHPAAAQSLVAVSLVAATQVRLDLHDALGRRLRTLHDGMLAAGRHDIALDLADLAPGSYLLVLTHAAGRSTRTFVRAR